MAGKIKKLFVISFLVGGLFVSGTAFAASVAGGTWHYGVGYTGTYGYSNYYHPSRSHTASVKQGQLVNSQRQGAREWAKASITKIPPTGLEYFYGF